MTRELCERCHGDGVIKIPGGISVCPTCNGDCWAPTPAPEFPREDVGTATDELIHAINAVRQALTPEALAAIPELTRARLDLAIVHAMRVRAGTPDGEQG